MYNPLLTMMALAIVCIGLITWQYSQQAELQTPRRQWLAASLLLAAGLMLEGEMLGASHLALALGSGLVMGGIALQPLILARLIGFALPLWLAALPAVYAVAEKWAPTLLWRVALGSVKLPVLYLLTAYLFQRAERQACGTRVSVTAILFIVGAALFSWRDAQDLYTLWNGLPRILDEKNPAHLLALSFGVAAQICGSVGFLHIVMQRQHKRLQNAAHIDALTGLGNRRALDNWLKAHAPPQRQVCVIMLDVDHFKAINDRYGHPVGDRVLQAFASLLLKHLRDPDQLVRFGGEEFCLLLPDASEDIGYAVADRLRQLFCRQPLLPDLPALTVSFSAGVSVWRGQGESFDHAQQRADQALYQAKRDGRNRVCLA
nr:GGDEF domain-containing protein [Chromobacterium sp. ASV5]